MNDRKKQLVFKFFDAIFLGYTKHGRRLVNMSSPHVLFEYKNKDNGIGFEYNTEEKSIRFNHSDFYTGMNMFWIDKPDFIDICKEYVSDKFDIPDLSSVSFSVRYL
jgi:hypothetical protein